MGIPGVCPSLSWEQRILQHPRQVGYRGSRGTGQAGKGCTDPSKESRLSLWTMRSPWKFLVEERGMS